MIRIRFVSLLVLVSVLAGCAPAARSDLTSSERLPYLNAVQVSQAAQPARIESFNPPGTGASVTVAVPVTVTNPNDFPVQIHGIEFSQSLGDAPAQAGRSGAANQTVQPSSSREFELILSRSLQQDPELLTRVAKAHAGGGLPFGVSGQVTYSSQYHPWHTTTGFQLNGLTSAGADIVRPEITVSAEDSSVFSLEDGSVVVRAVLTIRNAGSVGYLVHAKDLIAEVGGLPVASQDLPPTPVPAGETVTAAVNFMPSAGLLTAQARTVLSDALAGRNVELVLRGPVAWDVLGLDSFQEPGVLEFSTVLNSY